MSFAKSQAVYGNFAIVSKEAFFKGDFVINDSFLRKIVPKPFLVKSFMGTITNEKVSASLGFAQDYFLLFSIP